MRKLYKIVVPFVFAMFLTGCLQIETKVNVNKDGSGTIEETVLMSNEMVQMFNEFISGFADDSTETEEFNLFKEEELKSKVSDLGEGVTYVSGSEYKTDNKQGYKVLYSFTDINKLQIDQSPDSKIPEDTGVETKEKSYVKFSFDKGDIPQLKIIMPEPKKDEEKENESNDENMETESDSTNDEQLAQMQFLLKDLSFLLTVNVNGDIVESNADYVEGSNVTLFKVNFGELLETPEKLKEMEKMNPNDLKELKDIMKDIPGIKIETNDPVIIKFR